MAAVTITFPAATCVKGRTYRILDYSGNANTDNITLSAAGSPTIKGPFVIDTDNGGILMTADGTDWHSVYL